MDFRVVMAMFFEITLFFDSPCRCVDIQIILYLNIICHLDTLRVGVRHQNVPLLGDGHALRVGELAPAPPPGGNTLYLHIYNLNIY